MSDDLISRWDAIDALAYFTEKSLTGRTAQEVIKALPSAQRTGKWIYNDYGNGCGNWHCSVCNKIPIVYDKNANYCPYCGVKMKED